MVYSPTSTLLLSLNSGSWGWWDWISDASILIHSHHLHAHTWDWTWACNRILMLSMMSGIWYHTNKLVLTISHSQAHMMLTLEPNNRVSDRWEMDIGASSNTITHLSHTLAFNNPSWYPFYTNNLNNWCRKLHQIIDFIGVKWTQQDYWRIVHAQAHTLTPTPTHMCVQSHACKIVAWTLNWAKLSWGVMTLQAQYQV